MAKYIIKRLFSNIESRDYDETDSIKRMKDSDILAATPKEPTTTQTDVTIAKLTGAGIGTLIGRGVAKKRKKVGMIVGGTAGYIVGGNAISRERKKEKEEALFYNTRLQYAKKQARRRERKDWKDNMTGRDGYSY